MILFKDPLGTIIVYKDGPVTFAVKPGNVTLLAIDPLTAVQYEDLVASLKDYPNAIPSFNTFFSDPNNSKGNVIPLDAGRVIGTLIYHNGGGADGTGIIWNTPTYQKTWGQAPGDLLSAIGGFIGQVSQIFQSVTGLPTGSITKTVATLTPTSTPTIQTYSLPIAVKPPTYNPPPPSKGLWPLVIAGGAYILI